MELNVPERLEASNVLPRVGTLANLKIVRIAKEELSFNDTEYKALGLKQVGDRITWNPKIVAVKNVKLGEVATCMIVDALKKLEADGQLKEEQLSLYEKFIEKEIL